MRTAVRLLRAASVMLAGVGLAALGPVLRDMVRERAVRTWFRWLLAAFGVHFEVHGPQRFAPDVRGRHERAGVLVVANHSSWLDIVALNAVQPLRLVAKREIRDWAVLGKLASSTDKAKAERVMRAMMKMVKLDIKKLQQAATKK